MAKCAHHRHHCQGGHPPQRLPLTMRRRWPLAFLRPATNKTAKQKKQKTKTNKKNNQGIDQNANTNQNKIHPAIANKTKPNQTQKIVFFSFCRELNIG